MVQTPDQHSAWVGLRASSPSTHLQFYLGVHQTHWLEKSPVPLFVSHRRLSVSRIPRAEVDWALDSGGFTELSLFNEWRTTAKDYSDAVRRYSEEIGRLQFASPQDWMCEPFMLARTGLTVSEHQKRTVENYLELRTLQPDLPFIPVLQGWTIDDYLRHCEDYYKAGVDLAAEPLVGLGSVCRRQHTSQITALIDELSDAGLKLHGFGVKTLGFGNYGHRLASADSMAWSAAARFDDPLPHCTHVRCQNCLLYALKWRERALQRLEVEQLRLFSSAPRERLPHSA